MGSAKRMFPVLLLAVIPLAGLNGCTVSELETGYVPRKLGANAAARRGYYAAPFTIEAQAAQAASGTGVDNPMQDMRRPGGMR